MAPPELPNGEIAASPTNVLRVDGSTLEGGGQLIRNALILSALSSRPVRIERIRGNRPRGGGLKPSHAAAVNFLAEVTGSSVTGVEIGSKTIEFIPPLRPSFEQATRRNYHIKLDTPGSVFLIFQALFSYLLYSAVRMEKPVNLTITGGTNVTFSPSFEYVSQVLVPTFRKMGLPKLNVELLSRGWTTGRTQLGTVRFEIEPLPSGVALPAFRFTDRGEIYKISISILASCEPLQETGGGSKSHKFVKQSKSRDSVRSLLESEAKQAVKAAFENVEVETVLSAESGSDKRLYLLLVAHTTNGYTLGRDWLYDQKVTDLRKAVRILVDVVIQHLKAEIASGACVDEYMRDQVVIWQALAKGRSVVDGGVVDDCTRRPPSLHTRTAMWVAHELMETVFDQEGSCNGVAFKAGKATGDEVDDYGQFMETMERFKLEE